MTRRILTVAVFAAALWVGVVYAAINTVTAELELDW